MYYFARVWPGHVQKPLQPCSEVPSQSGGAEGLEAVDEVRAHGPCEAQQPDHVDGRADLPDELAGGTAGDLQLQLRIS